MLGIFRKGDSGEIVILRSNFFLMTLFTLVALSSFLSRRNLSAGERERERACFTTSTLSSARELVRSTKKSQARFLLYTQTSNHKCINPVNNGIGKKNASSS